METNIMVYLSERNIRMLVRQELKEVLIEEGMLQDISDWAGRTGAGKVFKHSLGIAMLMAALKPTKIAEAEIPRTLGTDSEQVVDMFNELGIRNFNSLANDPFTPEDKELLQATHQKILPYRQQLEKIKQAKQVLEQQYQEATTPEEEAEVKARYEKLKKLESSTNSAISSTIKALEPLSEKLAQQGDLAGVVMKNALENDGKLSEIDTQKVALEMVQGFASGNEQAQMDLITAVNDTINSDIRKFAASVTKHAGYAGVPLSDEDAFKIAASYADLNEFGLPSNATRIDVLKALENNKHKLEGKHSDFQTVKKYNLDGQIFTQLNVSMKEIPEANLDNQELADAEKQTIDSYQAGLYTAEEVPQGSIPTGTGTSVTIKEIILKSIKRGKNV